MTGVPVAVVQAAAAFGLDAAGLRRLGGNSGSSWGAGELVLRVRGRAEMDAELIAAAAAADVVPVPRVAGRAEFGAGSAVLLEMLPGQPAAELARRKPSLARAAGRACGAVHALLGDIPAPAGLPAVPGAPADDAHGTGQRLLHLDLHPLNVLAGDDGELTGVLDWANAAAGDPVLDRARSWAILTLDPGARARRAEPGWLALTEGWTESGGLGDIPPAARAWACRFMLHDLAGRYSAGDLRHVRQALSQAEAAAGRMRRRP